MSTIYDFDEKDPIFSIEAHYFNDGWDIKGFAFGDETGEKGDTIVICADGEFSEDLINNVEDVFVGKQTTYIVAGVPDDDEGVFVLEVNEMPTEEFKANWSERIWAKFRADRKVVCPLCGEKQAEFVSGATYMERLEQYYCENCNEAYITNAYGKFMRKGVLSDPINARDYW